MYLLRYILKWFRRAGGSWSHPYNVKVSPRRPEYVELVQSAYWRAVAHLEAAQYAWGHLHTIRKVEVRRGTRMACGGWAVKLKTSPTGYANGWCEKTRIVLVSNPDGSLDPKLVARMWAHALLQFCKVQSREEKNSIIRKAGLGE